MHASSLKALISTCDSSNMRVCPRFPRDLTGFLFLTWRASPGLAAVRALSGAGGPPIPNVGATLASSRHKTSTGTVEARVEAASARLPARAAADRLPQKRLNCVGVCGPWRLRNVRCSLYTLPSNICVGRWRCGLILLMTGDDPGTMGRTRSRTHVPKVSASAALLSGCLGRC